MARFFFAPLMIPDGFSFQADDSQMIVKRTCIELVSGGFTIGYVENGLEHMIHIDGNDGDGWEIQHHTMDLTTGEHTYMDRYLSQGGECGDTPTYGLPWILSKIEPDWFVPVE